MTGCASFCMVLSAVGAPLMAYFGWLCMNNSPMMEIPGGKAQKEIAGAGCYQAAWMYVFTFIGCFLYVRAAKGSQATEAKKQQAAKDVEKEKERLQAEVEMLRAQARSRSIVG
eukprot:TRINITY_DN32456_c0_g1_i1.p2 TRINITY_DN32456_c0_g1~~TRINITY_DN32456_c0_g1_i1.p2  ORF type:complete len:113 (-),score=32.67 TRINITY_DN32456_c0_g1_i1:62-400(-)